MRTRHLCRPCGQSPITSRRNIVSFWVIPRGLRSQRKNPALTQHRTPCFPHPWAHSPFRHRPIFEMQCSTGQTRLKTKPFHPNLRWRDPVVSKVIVMLGQILWTTLFKRSTVRAKAPGVDVCGCLGHIRQPSRMCCNVGASDRHRSSTYGGVALGQDSRRVSCVRFDLVPDASQMLCV